MVAIRTLTMMTQVASLKKTRLFLSNRQTSTLRTNWKTQLLPIRQLIRRQMQRRAKLKRVISHLSLPAKFLLTHVSHSMERGSFQTVSRSRVHLTQATWASAIWKMKAILKTSRVTWAEMAYLTRRKVTIILGSTLVWRALGAARPWPSTSRAWQPKESCTRWDCAQSIEYNRTPWNGNDAKDLWSGVTTRILKLGSRIRLVTSTQPRIRPTSHGPTHILLRTL